MSELTQAKVRELFDYHNGMLLWKVKPLNRIRIGDWAGSLNRSNGYRIITINGKSYQEARIVFLWHHGYLPTQIDHINRIRDDNRIENLREAIQNQNQWNRSKNKSSSSKYKGVYFNRNESKWQTQITKDRKMIYLGKFETEKEAALAYNQAAMELFGEFAHLNTVGE